MTGHIQKPIDGSSSGTPPRIGIWIAVTAVVIGCAALGLAVMEWSWSDNVQAEPIRAIADQKTSLLKKFTALNYERDILIASDNQPILLEFISHSCSVCRRMEPILHDIARELGDKVSVGIVPPEERPMYHTFGVKLVPTLFLVKNRKVAKHYIGFTSKAVLIKDLTEIVSSAGEKQI